MSDLAGQIEAAGGVLWRPAARPSGGVEVAIVHRPKYDDWSVPKGKLEPGEYPLLGALREVREETGFGAIPGRFVGEAHYRYADRPKRVRYWAMRAADGRFVNSDEVDRLVWLPLAEVPLQLNADYDQRIVAAFACEVRTTTPCIVVRASSADSLSPKAAAVVQVFEPTEIVGAGVGVARIAELVRSGNSVLCLAEPPRFDALASDLAHRFGGTYGAENAVAEEGFVVFHVEATGALVALDNYPAPD